MVVFHFWFNTNMPEIYKKYLASLDQFVPQHNVTHALYVDKLEHIEGLKEICPNLEIRDISPYLSLANNVSKVLHIDNYAQKYGPMGDFIRYKISDDLAKAEDYVYFLDVDIFFSRDPFIDILIPRSTSIFFNESNTTEPRISVCTGIYGLSHKSIIMHEIVKLCMSVILLPNITLYNAYFYLFGPRFLSKFLQMVPQNLYTIESDCSIFFSGEDLFYSIFQSKDQTERFNNITQLVQLIKSSPKAVAFHLFKPCETSKESIEKIGTAIMEELQK